MSRSPLHRSVLAGLVAGLSVVASTAGCVRTPSNLAGPATTPSAESLAPKVVAQVLRQRTAAVKVYLEVGGSGGRAELSGPVDYTTDGVDADLTGTVTGRAVHLIVLGDTVYVSQLFDMPAGTTWIKMAAGDVRASDSPYWVDIDQIVTGLSYATDETLLAGLAYNAAPPETVDGVAVRTAVANATEADMLAKFKPAQLSRYERSMGHFTGARIIVSVGDDAIPRRISVTPTGAGYFPTIELDYTNWATTTVAITAPSGPDVRDYP